VNRGWRCRITREVTVPKMEPSWSVSSLFAILCLLLLGWFWLDSLRAREIALAICKRACESEDLQLLDQTVALRRLGLSWRAEGLRLRRVYRFEYSEEGVGRRAGHLVLRGTVPEVLRFDDPWGTWGA